MAALEVTLIIIGIIFVIVSFFVEEKLSQKDIDKIASLSENELKIIVERQLRGANDQIEDSIEQSIADSQETVRRAMEKETNEKIMAIDEYSNTVIESMNKTHNEILFLYNMLNDKHTELTQLAGQVQQFSEQVRNTENEVLGNIAEAARELEAEVRQQPEPVYESRETQWQEPENTPADSHDSNNNNSNNMILALHKEGLSEVEIARELGLGLGEVKLVIDLYKGGQGR